jgi:hypothetical protein
VRADEEDVEPVCLRCGDSFTVDDGCENDGFCHGCAHAMVDEARAWLESYVPGPGTTLNEMLREWRRLCRAMLVEFK